MYGRAVVRVAILVGLFGFIMSRRQVLEWIAPMSSLNALILWYLAFAAFLTILGFYIFQARWNVRYTVALLLISWALGVVLYLPISGYSTNITGAELTGVEAATEDMVTWNTLNSMGIHDSTGIITYAVVPALLILLAGYVVAPALFSRIFRSVVGRT